LAHLVGTARLGFTNTNTIDTHVIDGTQVIVTAQGFSRLRFARTSLGVTGSGLARVSVSRVAVLGDTRADTLRAANISFCAKITIITRTAGSNASAYTSTRYAHITNSTIVVIIASAVGLHGGNQHAAGRSFIAHLIVATDRGTITDTRRNIHAHVILTSGSLTVGTRTALSGNSTTNLDTSIHREIIRLDASQYHNITITITISIRINKIIGTSIGQSPYVSSRTSPVHLVFSAQGKVSEQIFTVGIGSGTSVRLIVTVQSSDDIRNSRLIGN